MEVGSGEGAWWLCRATTLRRRNGVLCNVNWVAVKKHGPWPSNPQVLKLAIETRNVTTLVWKEPRRVKEAERYQQDIVGLTSTQSFGSGTSILGRGWTLFYAGLAPGERQRAGGGFIIASWLSTSMLEFTPLREWVDP